MFQNIKTAYRDLRRLRQIVAILLKNELGYYVEKLQLKHHAPARMRNFRHDRPGSLPFRLRAAFEDLGPVFIKLGQFLSLRPDLVPKEFCDEFAKLQDSVEEFPYKEALSILERELKKSYNEVFSHINQKPIASASIGQVYKAKLLNREVVIIKIQRPGIKEVIETDINLLYHLAELAQKHIHELSDYDLTGMIKEFERYTHEELNYYIEAKNIEKFYHNFQKDRIVKIPGLYNDYTTSKVLVMEYIDGIKIDDIEQFDSLGYSRQTVAHNVAQAMFKQVFEFGFFHADPHPANIFVLPKNRIAFLDYGIVGRITPELKEKLVELFFALLNKNIEKVADSFINLGIMEEEKPKFRETLLFILEDYEDMAINEINFALLFDDMLNIAWKYKLKLSPDFLLLTKAIVTAEGFGQRLDPEFRLSVEMAEYAAIYMKKNGLANRFRHIKKQAEGFMNIFASLPERIDGLLAKAERGELKVDIDDKDVKKLGLDIDTSSNRISIGLIIAALIVGGALVLQTGQYAIFALLSFAIAIVMGLFLISSIIRENRR